MPCHIMEYIDGVSLVDKLKDLGGFVGEHSEKVQALVCLPFWATAQHTYLGRRSTLTSYDQLVNYA